MPQIKGFLKNPLFYFGIVFIILVFGIYSACVNLDGIKSSAGSRLAFFNSYSDKISGINKDSLFTSQIRAIPLETPDLKIIQDNTLGQVSTPSVVSGKVLGDVFGGSGQDQKEVANYLVQPGDTLQSIASSYNISLNTLLWANDLTSTSSIKVGQELVILPVDGVLHVVKSGDTISNIAQTYKTNSQDVIALNSLASQDDIYIGDVLIVPGGIMPKKPVINNQIPVVDNFFIFPVQGRITQGLHFYNAVDIANKCGTPIYAAAAGVIQRVVGNGKWNSGMGNYLTILHSNGTVTYYGHLMTLLVKPGDNVYTGQNIGFVGGAPGMAGAGKSTGCHLHFEVIGAKNPLSAYYKGSVISYK
jgi:murein DD-endopeptidase MepM/ murein hydrolase activator NlpD